MTRRRVAYDDDNEHFAYATQKRNLSNLAIIRRRASKRVSVRLRADNNNLTKK